jgi:soluble lytic murein transglycosylase-like protein
MAKSHPARIGGVSRRYAKWARHTVTSLTLLAALAALSLILHNQYDGSRLLAVIQASLRALGFTPAVAAAKTLPPIRPADAAQYQALGEYLAHRYHVNSAITTEIVASAYAAGRAFDLDPLLILAVISVESSFNPIAESGRGAQGLMQVIPRLHDEKFDAFGGTGTVFQPATNIVVGSQILKEYLARSGDLNAALHRYGGASSPTTQTSYSEKVLTERARLHQVLRQYQNRHQQFAQS